MFLLLAGGDSVVVDLRAGRRPAALEMAAVVIGGGVVRPVQSPANHDGDLPADCAGRTQSKWRRRRRRTPSNKSPPQYH